MDFFQSQDDARRKTRLLIGLFAAAVIVIAALVNVLVYLVLRAGNTHSMMTGQVGYSPALFAGVSLLVIMVVGLASLYRTFSLKRGGPAVAEMLGGRLLVDGGDNLSYQRLLNIVEEMAIAAGLPVPQVYVVPDDAINAFAAGHGAGDAVIGVTEGAIRALDRDEMQGVVAHEFSHILNGDMRLNLRLMGVLFGILVLAVIGRILLSPGRVAGSRRDGGLALLVLGVGLVVVGYAGQFFGNLIKAAVSRQREFLADASAVQFTRNPVGIAGALRKIADGASGSVLQHPESEELSHAFFSEGVRNRLGRLTATHPPLAERISRINPAFAAGLGTSEPSPTAEPDTGASMLAGAAGLASAAGEMISELPDPLGSAARDPFGARALVYRLLLDRDGKIEAQQLALLESTADPRVCLELARLRNEVPTLPGGESTLTLLELSLPALRQLTRKEYRRLMDNVNAMMRADDRVSLYEWVFHRFLVHHLGSAFGETRPVNSGRGLPEAEVQGIATLLSLVAHADRDSDVPAEQAFMAGCDALGISLELVARADLGGKVINGALDRLAKLQPLTKPRVIKAMIAVVEADGRISALEAQLVRTLSDVLDCPLPPLTVTRAHGASFGQPLG